MNVKVSTLKCFRCGYEWTPRQSDIRRCPKCKSVYWDKPRRIKKVA